MAALLFGAGLAYLLLFPVTSHSDAAGDLREFARFPCVGGPTLLLEVVAFFGLSYAFRWGLAALRDFDTELFVAAAPPRWHPQDGVLLSLALGPLLQILGSWSTAESLVTAARYGSLLLGGLLLLREATGFRSARVRGGSLSVRDEHDHLVVCRPVAEIQLFLDEQERLVFDDKGRRVMIGRRRRFEAPTLVMSPVDNTGAHEGWRGRSRWFRRVIRSRLTLLQQASELVAPLTLVLLFGPAVVLWPLLLNATVLAFLIPCWAIAIGIVFETTIRAARVAKQLWLQQAGDARTGVWLADGVDDETDSTLRNVIRVGLGLSAVAFLSITGATGPPAMGLNQRWLVFFVVLVALRQLTGAAVAQLVGELHSVSRACVSGDRLCIERPHACSTMSVAVGDVVVRVTDATRTREILVAGREPILVSRFSSEAEWSAFALALENARSNPYR